MNTKIPQNLFLKAFTRDKKINHKFQILQNVRETVKCRGFFFQQMSKMPAFLIGKTTLRIKTWRVTGDSHKNKINTNFTRCHRMGKMLTLFFPANVKVIRLFEEENNTPHKILGAQRATFTQIKGGIV